MVRSLLHGGSKPWLGRSLGWAHRVPLDPPPRGLEIGGRGIVSAGVIPAPSACLPGAHNPAGDSPAGLAATAGPRQRSTGQAAPDDPGRLRLVELPPARLPHRV